MPDQAAETILALNAQLAELDELVPGGTQSLRSMIAIDADIGLYSELLTRWHRRTAEAIADKVSAAEGVRFSRLAPRNSRYQRSSETIRANAQRARATLVALIEEISRHGLPAADSQSAEQSDEPLPAEPLEPRIFIGHGGSAAWQDLRQFLTVRLNLTCVEFNSDPSAGLANKERLLQMLADSTFAFLVMTAEDLHADGTAHARENVIHELGLFQERLGFERAIVLLEEGCKEFSNMTGVTQIRFPAGNVMAKSEEIRRTLEREGMLAGYQ